MQAYALRNVLETMGHQVCVIQKMYPYTKRQKILFFLSKIKRKISTREYVKFTINGDYNYRSQNVRVFHSKYLNFTDKVHTSKQLSNYINNNLDAVVVGSDQIWRPKYVSCIYDFYLNGVNDSIKKIAYAASFGVKFWEYTNEQTHRCAELIRKFSYVSVREQSGVKLIHENLGKDVCVDWVLDPTLLLTMADYSGLINDRPANAYRQLFTYILDETTFKLKVVEDIKNALNLSLNRFNTKAENGTGASLKERVAPEVEEWLNGFRNAEFVITDSFHGTVFSLIFNKPFVVLVNKERGAERFESILNKLGLADRMISDLHQFDMKLCSKHIDWVNINQNIARERGEIINTLKNKLDSIKI